MRIPSGKVDQVIFFVGLDAADTLKTGLTTFTVYRSRNGGSATVYTTPTVAELDATNMPGVYSLLLDEDTTIASTSDSEEYCVRITQASMQPVTRTIELYRRDTTSGRTLDVSAGGEAGLDWGNIGSPTTTVGLSNTTVLAVSGAVGSVTGAVGSVTGAVGSVTGAVGSVTGAVGSVAGNVVGSIGSLATQAKADVNAEADAALADYDAPTHTELTSELATADDAVLTAVAALSIPNAAANAAAVWATSDDGKTMIQHIILQSAVLLGQAASMDGPSTTFKAIDGSVTRVTSTVGSGNRGAPTMDVS